MSVRHRGEDTGIVYFLRLHCRSPGCDIECLRAMRIQRIIVCEAQVPFVRGGAEYLVRTLVDQLLQHGFAAELVSIPFKWYPKREILAHAAAWRLIDLSESNGQPIDLVIASKFPTYFVRHPNKAAWLGNKY